MKAMCSAGSASCLRSRSTITGELTNGESNEREYSLSWLLSFSCIYIYIYIYRPEIALGLEVVGLEYPNGNGTQAPDLLRRT